MAGVLLLVPLPVVGIEVLPELVRSRLRSKIDWAPFLAPVELNPLAGDGPIPADVLPEFLLVGSIAYTLPVLESLV